MQDERVFRANVNEFSEVLLVFFDINDASSVVAKDPKELVNVDVH
jgi:hypothetical protein